MTFDRDYPYRVTKTYGHEQGLSAVFRQPDATSHCRFPHGYALGITLGFAAPRLNRNNWVIDFGSLKSVKAWLKNSFDHKTLLARNDPALEDIDWLYRKHHWDPPIIIPRVGCEGFAEWIADNVIEILQAEAEEGGIQGDVTNDPFLHYVEVREHGANSATFYPEPIFIGGGNNAN